MAGESQRAINVIKTVIEQSSGSGSKFNYTPGVVVTDYGSGYLSMVYARVDELLDEVLIPDGMVVNAGDYVMVAETGTGDAWIEFTMPQSLYSKMAVDYERREILTGDGDTPPVNVLSFDSAGNATVVGNTTLEGSLDAGDNTISNPLDPTDGSHVGDRDYNDLRYVILSSIYPIGSLYTSTNSTMPTVIDDLGTWVAYAKGQVMVGVDEGGDADWDAGGDTGGAKTVASNVSVNNESGHTHTYNTVISHGHTASSSQAGHTHVQTHFAGTGATTRTDRLGSKSGAATASNSTGSASAGTITTSVVATGSASGTTQGGASHGHTTNNNATSVVQPYVAVYMWERTA